MTDKALKETLMNLMGRPITSKDATMVDAELFKHTGVKRFFSTCSNEIRARVLELYKLLEDESN